jgi:maintenance of morphology protein 1
MSTRDLRNQVAGVYRSKLRDDLHGAEGDEVLRQRVENFIDLMGPFGVVVSTFPLP